MEGNPQAVPAKTAEQPAAYPFLGGPGARAQKRCQQVSPGADESGGFDQADEPNPKGKIKSEVQGKQQRESVQPSIFKQGSERTEPAEPSREKNDPGQISQQQVPQPAALRVFLEKPDRGDGRRQCDPAEPCLIERWKARGIKKTAQGGGRPRPKPQQFHEAGRHAHQLAKYSGLAATMPCPVGASPAPAGRAQSVAQIARIRRINPEQRALHVFHGVNAWSCSKEHNRP